MNILEVKYMVIISLGSEDFDKMKEDGYNVNVINKGLGKVYQGRIVDVSEYYGNGEFGLWVDGLRTRVNLEYLKRPRRPALD
jgi:hypothetical protein